MPEPVNGTCHCGAVSVSVSEPPTEVTECHCSICRRYGALWAYYGRDEVTLTGPTQVYAWNHKAIGYHRCAECGCIIAWLPLRKDIPHRAVNARMLDGFDLQAVTLIVEEDASM